MAMRIRRYDAERIAQYGRSRATLDASPTTQLIEATSCVERLNTTIKAKEHRLLSSYQMLTADKNH